MKCVLAVRIQLWTLMKSLQNLTVWSITGKSKFITYPLLTERIKCLNQILTKICKILWQLKSLPKSFKSASTRSILKSNSSSSAMKNREAPKEVLGLQSELGHKKRTMFCSSRSWKTDPECGIRWQRLLNTVRESNAEKDGSTSLILCWCQEVDHGRKMKSGSCFWCLRYLEDAGAISQSSSWAEVTTQSRTTGTTNWKVREQPILTRPCTASLITSDMITKMRHSRGPEIKQFRASLRRRSARLNCSTSNNFIRIFKRLRPSFKRIQTTSLPYSNTSSAPRFCIQTRHLNGQKGTNLACPRFIKLSARISNSKRCSTKASFLTASD